MSFSNFKKQSDNNNKVGVTFDKRWQVWGQVDILGQKNSMKWKDIEAVSEGRTSDTNINQLVGIQI